jgi:hypothetical protein
MWKRINFKLLLAQYLSGLLTFLVLSWLGYEHTWSTAWLVSTLLTPACWIIIEAAKGVLNDETNRND